MFAVGSWNDNTFLAVVVGLVSIVVLVAVILAKIQRPIEKAHLDRSWVCARCGYQWEPPEEG